MCLDAHAHGMRVDHEIFRAPNRVKLTIEQRPTPGNYVAYPSGRSLGKTMPMWRVQTEGYTTHPGQLIGIVSSDWGFLDSPDTEWISGGVNTKGPRAVAIGRHANFFHWGFAASPTFMTDEAKDVFVNAVHYIAKFAGHMPIARKKRGTMTRDYVDVVVDSLSEEGHERTLARYRAFVELDKKRRAEIQKRLDAGEQVSKFDRRILEMRFPPAPTRLQQARRLVPKPVIEELDDDPAKISAWLRANRPFFRVAGPARLEVDEELKVIGIASDDIALLDRLVVKLSAGDHDGLAKKLLERYTTESYPSARRWAKWLETNRSRLFFTEAGGYKWLVNSMRVHERRASSAVFERQKPSAQKSMRIKATAATPFASGLSLKQLRAGRFELTLDVDIHEGWHAYDAVPANSGYRPLSIDLELPKGVRRVGKWQKPVSVPSTDEPGLTLFEGPLRFRCELESSKAAEVICKVRYQVCNANRCMEPAEAKHRIRLTR